MRARLLLSAALAATIASAAFAIQPAQAHGDLVALPEAYAPGTIVVKTSERHLYLVVGGGQAIRYPVGVGRAGQQWSGTSVIEAKYVSPDWAPPPDIRRENPKLPPLIPGGSPHNPMGVAAMTLAGLDYAIHAPISRLRSAISCRTAASACSTKTSRICLVASGLARRWW